MPMGLEDIATGYINPINTGVGAVTGAVDWLGDITGLWSSSSSKKAEKMAKLQLENQMKLMDHANDLQVAQWNRENEYNNPYNQMQRLQQAGLNPLSHGLDGNSAGGLSPVTAPSAPDMGSMLNAAGNSMKLSFDRLMQSAELARINEETKQMQIETKWYNKFKELDYNLKQQELTGKEKDNQLRDDEHGLKQQQYQANEYALAIDKATNEFMLLPKKFIDENGNEYEARPIDVHLQNQLDTMSANLAEVNERVANMQLSNEQLREMRPVWKAQARHEVNMMNLKEAEKRALIGQAYAMIDRIGVETKTASFNLGQLEKWSDKFNRKQNEINTNRNRLLKKQVIEQDERNRQHIWTIDISRYGASAARYGAYNAAHSYATQEVEDLEGSIHVVTEASNLVNKVVSTSSKSKNK